MDDKQQARELHAISQQHGMAGAAFKDFFDKTPFLLNDLAMTEEQIAERKSREFDAYTYGKRH